jgi:hypothetical protein
MCLGSVYLLFVDPRESFTFFTGTIIVATLLKTSSVEIESDEEYKENDTQEIKE